MGRLCNLRPYPPLVTFEEMRNICRRFLRPRESSDEIKSVLSAPHSENRQRPQARVAAVEAESENDDQIAINQVNAGRGRSNGRNAKNGGKKSKASSLQKQAKEGTPPLLHIICF